MLQLRGQTWEHGKYGQRALPMLLGGRGSAGRSLTRGQPPVADNAPAIAFWTQRGIAQKLAVLGS